MKQIKKAQKMTEALKRLLPRYGGPPEHKGRLYKNVTESILLYGASVWGTSVIKNKTKIGQLLREQRRLGLCICRGFRTVATDVVLVLARMIPLDPLIREAGCRETSKKERRQATMRCWEAKHGDIDGGVTQFLTGHGYFGNYLQKIGKAANGRCSECPDREDTPEHAWDDCPLWTPERMRLRDSLTEVPKYWTVVDEMLRCKRRWEAISSTMNAIVAKKSRLIQMPR
ncbi:UNVERIFIED_CONTAM: hypothetical protein PYX00_000757 [Menopon gallinae]|uniref:Reverse transcriptase n=1 Tax=Menopon gallinae TaxID=328185 RepID=A0AAW2IBL1_9NEOP